LLTLLDTKMAKQKLVASIVLCVATSGLIVMYVALTKNIGIDDIFSNPFIGASVIFSLLILCGMAFIGSAIWLVVASIKGHRD